MVSFAAKPFPLMARVSPTPAEVTAVPAVEDRLIFGVTFIVVEADPVESWARMVWLPYGSAGMLKVAWKDPVAVVLIVFVSTVPSMERETGLVGPCAKPVPAIVIRLPTLTLAGDAVSFDATV
jgi:hypothetical protein